LNRHPADDAIQAALRRNDPAAVELIWQRYARDLLTLLQAVLRSKHDAEDVLQAVFVRIVRKRRRLAGATHLDAYICRIARNEAAAFLGRRRRHRCIGPDDESWLTTVEPGAGQNELVEGLQTALGSLPQPQREVIVLKVYGDKTFEEIARMLGLSVNTAASRYRYGMEKLRTLLKDFGP